jgi:lipopolysaccharide/colanic/teichoic acid biosynthesis glycosyltransferase
MNNPARTSPAAAIPFQSPNVMPRWKRALDIVGCLAAMPFLLPLVVFMAIVTRFWAPGPIFFRQERIGINGSRFTMFKFRTMKAGAPTSSHQTHLKDLIKSNKPMVKLDAKSDSRIIPFGRILRATGLDELPQVFNVLQGNMSLVGPRPCVQYEFEDYLPWQKERLNALPGLTGLWQVSGKNRLTFEQMIHLDIRYTREKSLWMDLRCIVMTIPALVIQVMDTRRAQKAADKAAATAAQVPHAVGAEVINRNARRELVRFRFPAETSAAQD